MSLPQSCTNQIPELTKCKLRDKQRFNEAMEELGKMPPLRLREINVFPKDKDKDPSTSTSMLPENPKLREILSYEDRLVLLKEYLEKYEQCLEIENILVQIEDDKMSNEDNNTIPKINSRHSFNTVFRERESLGALRLSMISAHPNVYKHGRFQVELRLKNLICPLIIFIILTVILCTVHGLTVNGFIKEVPAFVILGLIFVCFVGSTVLHILLCAQQQKHSEHLIFSKHDNITMESRKVRLQNSKDQKENSENSEVKSLSVMKENKRIEEFQEHDCKGSQASAHFVEVETAV